MLTKYLDGFRSVDDVNRNFSDSYKEQEQFVTDDEMLIAIYDLSKAYEGYGLVLFVRDGKLWQVNGSHCSCYGLEGQWKPEEIENREHLDHYLDKAWGTWELFNKEIREAAAGVIF